ncbi:cytokinin riboside 5'-monophosphate phosphoribohydrolase log7 [Phtheirospermum japonicum]|uniref:Cytokinin riboside 5'-monophosphate phosphoribohydrolase log7 n=1 Tax=Phtheirospermum japonicum TaxID=374723 RepID=A0A830CAX4_9LAMI|nr:cytokinin riboside 5'-monophosphate phosphoribohydrolase log7 [Phtheirospermum japonicum]GFQ06055.1 cytokinin riboside 5'-monophosphate phosphoribohydrolase log7 [Phtheirospermum japonicum]
MENSLQQPNKSSRFQRICVFCGSSPGKNPSYQLAAIQLGKQLVIIYLFIYLLII